MRTLDELIKQDFNDLTYGELSEYNLECKEHCPLYKYGYCSGGMVCYGGEPLEPPCCGFDNDTNLDEWCHKAWESEKKHIEWQKERERKLALEKEKSELRKRKLLEYRIRNSKELEEIRRLKSKIKRENKRIKAIENLRIFANVVNDVNRMFREANQPNNQPDIDDSKSIDVVDEIKNNIHNMELSIIEIKDSIKEKEKLFKEGNKK